MKLLKASKILHIVVLLCCFLPAIIPTCGGPSKEELELKAKTYQDSIIEVAKADSLKLTGDSAFVENKTDTNFVDTTAVAINADTIKTDTTVVESAKDTAAVKNKEEANILKKALQFLLMPDKENYSLVGFAVLCSAMASPVIFMLMLIWSVGLRFTSSNHKLIFIQSVLGIGALTLYISSEYFTAVMWGFWMVYALSLFNAILNWRIYFESKRNKLTNVWGEL